MDYVLKILQQTLGHDAGIKSLYNLTNYSRARNNWVSGCPGHPKMVTETQFMDQDFRPETLKLSGRWSILNLGFQILSGKSKYCTGF